ncbi:MAG TPA: hypothetical protein VIY86_08610, partial [Pirellulaceae bacterium]
MGSKPPRALRKELDRIDRNLVELVVRRGQCITEFTRTHPEVRDRVAELMMTIGVDRVLFDGTGAQYPARAMRSAFLEIVGGCRELARPARVGYLGPAYSHSHLAAWEY